MNKVLSVILAMLAVFVVATSIYLSLGKVWDTEVSLPRAIQLDKHSALDVEHDVLAGIAVELNNSFNRELQKNYETSSYMNLLVIILGIFTLIFGVSTSILLWKCSNKALYRVASEAGKDSQKAALFTRR